LCGTWLYVYGEGTKAIKDNIKALGFWWASKKTNVVFKTRRIYKLRT